jgi:UDP-N-acetylglucosamine acyltransferase
MIHPTAVIHPKARLDSTVRVGPYAVIDEHVEVGAGCIIGPHAYLTGRTTIGMNNKFFSGCVVGEAPQDLKYKGEPSQCRIGDRNTFREHVTVHRANKTEDATVIGTQNLLMAHCHIAHDCQIGNYVIIVNGALIGGHVTLGDRALISGNCLLHQFVRVGTLALMQGGSAISKDLAPYTVARGINGICGLNTLGLRRAGYTGEQRLELRQLYHALFREEGNLRTALAKAQKEFSSPAAKVMLEFIATAGKRGIVLSESGKGKEMELEGEEE